MNRNNRTGATDEVIGLVFKRSLIVVAVLAAFIVAVVLLKKTLREDETLVDAPPVAQRGERRFIIGDYPTALTRILHEGGRIIDYLCIF